MITLDSIRQSIETKYATFDIDFGVGRILSLRNPLRMPEEDRETLRSFGDRVDAAETPEEQAKVVGDLIVTVATDKLLAQAFVTTITAGEDAALMLMEVVAQYMAAQQVGEA